MKNKLKINTIVENSTTLFELSNNFDTNIDIFNKNEITKERLNNWSIALNDKDNIRINSRLRHFHMNLQPTNKKFRYNNVEKEITLPKWALYLTEIVELYDVNCYSNLHFSFDKNNEIAFQELFLPFVKWANNRIINVIENRKSIIDNKALNSLEKSLIANLSEIHTKVLESEFIIFKSLQQSSIMSLVTKINSSQDNEISNNIYNSFLRYMFKGGYINLLNEYSVLARLAVTITVNWINSTLELIERLIVDFSCIQNLFFPNQKISKLTNIESGMSDMHNGGRSVLILCFDKGCSLVYKPRSLCMEESLSNIINWYNKEHTSLKLKTLQILNRNSYGWMEYVQHIPCNKISQITNYYKRSGILLAILYAINCSDCHLDNVIACGEYPVVIDVECIMSPSVSFVDVNNNSTNQSILYRNTVISTGLVPSNQMIIKNTILDTAGFGTMENNNKKIEKIDWKNINSDIMSQELLQNPIRTSNIPFINNELFYPEHFVSPLIKGFKEAFTFLIEKYEENSFRNTPIFELQARHPRLIYRSTRFYKELLLQSIKSKYLRYGIDRSLMLECLCKNYFLLSNCNPNWTIIDEEIKSITQYDIPYILYSINENIITINDKAINEFFNQNSSKTLNWFSKTLTHSNLKYNCSLIKELYIKNN